MLRFVRILVVLALVVGVLGAFVSTAEAAPSNSPRAIEVALTCGSAGNFTVLVNGNGKYGAAHEVGSNRIFIPVAFGEATGTFTPPGGEPQPFTDPAHSHPMPQNNAQTIECSFHVDLSDPAGGHVVVNGTVSGFIVPGTNR